MEVVNIKQCKNLSTSGIYNVKYTDINSNRINILDNNEKIKNPSNRNDEYLFEIETNNLKNEIEKQRKEQKVKELEELREKQRKELKELEELKEKQRKEQKVKELEELLKELKEKQSKEQKQKETRKTTIKDETNLLFD